MRLINRKPARPARVALGALPFLLAILAYAIGSAIRRAENPADKLLPSFEAIATAFSTMAFVADRRTGDYLLWVDTMASLERLTIGMTIAALIALGLLVQELRGLTA